VLIINMEFLQASLQIWQYFKHDVGVSRLWRFKSISSGLWRHVVLYFT